MPRRPGRPSKLTPETKQKLLETLAAGNHYEIACAFVGIDYSTFRKWMVKGEEAKEGEYSEFFEDVQRAIAKAEVASVAKIKRAESDDWRAAAWMLERRHPDRWASTQRIRVEVEKQMEAEYDLFFAAIAQDVELTPDAKRRIIQIASDLQSRAEVAGAN